MTAKKQVLILTFILAVFASQIFGQTASPVPSDDEIRKILVQRIDVAKQSVGIVVGVIEPQGRRIISYGVLAKDDKRPLNGDTLFEIGSISKVFTSLLMSDMVQRREVALTDPIAKYLPPSGVKVPERNGRSITLQDLSTHTSGLPRMPSNFKPKDPDNPYADYSVEQLYQFLSGYTLPRDIGAQYEYSNLGGGLLGHVLSLRAGKDYEALVRERITGPLDMSSTRITLSPDLRARLAVGHNERLAPVSNWDLPTLAGAGALRSSANDLLNFLAANLGYTTAPLAPSMARMLSVRRPTGGPGLDIALGWHVFTTGGKDIIWHNGGTGGYRTFIGYDPKAKVGVVVLSNTSTTVGVDDIGHHLVDPTFPLLPPNSPLLQPPKTHTEITMDPKKFDAFAGTYQFMPELTLTISRDDAHFYGQLTGQSKYEIFAEAEHDFFFKIVDAQLTFEVDNNGRATSVFLHQLGRIQRATRFEGAPQQLWFGHKVNAVEPAVFDRYLATYQLAPGVTVTVTREDAHLYAQLTGQPKFELFPESERDYFLKVVDAQLTFETNAAGRATAAVLHQNGRDQRAARIE
jgi:CubicO group peptidase (beta-lactamase class C family)